MMKPTATVGKASAAAARNGFRTRLSCIIACQLVKKSALSGSVRIAAAGTDINAITTAAPSNADL